MITDQITYRGYRYAPEIISQAVWLYHRFCLSFRDVEDLLAERGIVVSYETIRQWCRKFGPPYARAVRRGQGELGDTWFLDEVFVTIQGRSLPRADSAEGVSNAPFQVAGSGSAIPGGTCSGRQSLSARSTSDPGNPLSAVSCSGVCRVAGADVRSLRVLAPAKVLILPRQDQVDSTHITTR